ncbi:MAG: hypothetical protein J6038_03260, partial [Bacilli bacterium]|nr:hypothetical protein [Bacilli bacterium]
LVKEYTRAKNLFATAPGYPFGFKDDIGLKASSEDIFAKAFTDGKRLSIAYTLLYPAKDEVIQVDLSALGLGEGVRTIPITGSMNSCGLEVIDL